MLYTVYSYKYTGMYMHMTYIFFKVGHSKIFQIFFSLICDHNLIFIKTQLSFRLLFRPSKFPFNFYQGSQHINTLSHSENK